MKLNLDENSSEHYHQVALVSWFRKTFPKVLIHSIPNGGFRTISNAAYLKAEGATAGMPDLFIPEWNVWVEMKKMIDGEVSNTQEKIIGYLKSRCGHTVIVGYGFEDAKLQLLNWKKQYAC